MLRFIINTLVIRSLTRCVLLTNIILSGLFQNPVFSIKQISDSTGKSYNTVHSIINHFVELRWVTAVSEKQRNKIYRFNAYLSLLE